MMCAVAPSVPLTGLSEKLLLPLRAMRLCIFSRAAVASAACIAIASLCLRLRRRSSR